MDPCMAARGGYRVLAASELRKRPEGDAMPAPSIPRSFPVRSYERPVDTNVLAVRWRDHSDWRARDELFDRFLPLARRLARRYDRPHEPFDDLMQVASVGLLGAIDRFDPERGVAFVAFAIPTILGELKRYFRATGWSAHVPRAAQETALRIDRAIEEITAASGHGPGVCQLAEYLEESAEDVLIGLDARAAHYATSLDAPLAASDADDPTSLMDTLGREDGRYGLVDMTASLGAAIARLPYLERAALRPRLERNLKQAEIAHELGCSQMQVSRLQRRAAERLREMTAGGGD
jgi:RNA polymerase sigma-B factor